MLLMLVNALSAKAQISFTGATYTQDFNSLVTSGTNNAWTNNSTLAGWHLFRQPVPATAIILYNSDAGGSSTGTFLSYGSASVTERALGGLGSGGAYFGSPASGAIAGWIGVAFTNNTGSTINEATIGFNGEQWRNGGNATAQTMILEYGFGASFAAVSAWVSPGNTFDWSSVVNSTTAGAVDGNIAGRVSNKGGTINALNWANESTLWIRWVERNDAGNDHGLAIDDFSFSLPASTPVVTITATDASAAEAGLNPGTFRISRTGSTSQDLIVNYSISGGATNGTDYTPTLTDAVIIPIGSSFVDLTITPVDDADNEGNETAIITLLDGAAYDLGTDIAATVTIADNDVPLVITKIHEIQGNTATQLPNIAGSGVHNDRSPLEGQTVTIEGIVTAVYNDLNAFFIQEEDSDADGDATTSEGVFVFTSVDPAVSVGDKVRVTGAVDEFFGMTQLDNDNANLLVTLVSSGNVMPSSVVIDLPIASNQDINDFYEQFEGMRIQFQDKLVVSEYFEMSRYGQIVLTENSRPYIYTHGDNTPTALEYSAFEADRARRTIILDDENNIQNAPLPNGVFFHPRPNGFGTGTQGVNYFRGGDVVNNLTGVLHWSFSGQSGTDAWRIRPVSSSPVQFSVENSRPAQPAGVGGNIIVAGFNVLNYFTTIDNGSNGGRGADSQDELDRQTQKLVQALLSINADVFGLIEIENNNNGALISLTNALNAQVGAGTYSYITTGTVGTDNITCAVIYKTAAVTPEGSTAILNSSAFTDPNNTGTQRNRPAVAVSFKVTDNTNPDFGAIFTVVVNHLKSKGGGGASGADLDQNDGQSFWNDTRTKSAQALAAWLATDPTGSKDADFLIIGDLNAYKGENPITALKNAGMTDLIETFLGNQAYGYVFDGQLGYLDHALANNTLASQVTGVTEWHINADEVNVFDYNNNIDDGAGESSFEAKPTGNNLFEANAFRTSDHDPVIIGLDLEVPCVLTCPENIEVNSSPGMCGANVNFAAATTGNCGTVSYDKQPGSFFPVGTTTVNVNTTSGQTCSLTVTVKDNQPPVINTVSDPVALLWPPNHKYQTLEMAGYITSVTDNCGNNILPENVTITKVTSDEPENMPGDADGNTIKDIRIAANCKSVSLRRERNEFGNGRVYTIHLAVSDAAGNIGNAVIKVYVPANQGNNAAVTDDGPQFTVNGSCGISLSQSGIEESSRLLTEETDIVKVQNYPNPFKGSTTIRYVLANNTPVRLVVYNQYGQKVAELVNAIKSAGEHKVTFNAVNQASGLYIYSIQTIDGNGKTVMKNGKMIIEK